MIILNVDTNEEYQALPVQAILAAHVIYIGGRVAKCKPAPAPRREWTPALGLDQRIDNLERQLRELTRYVRFSLGEER